MADSMEKMEKLHYYMDMYIDHVFFKHTGGGFMRPISFEEFCNKEKAIKNVFIGDDWKQRGYAAKEWITLHAGYLYHRVYHNLKIKSVNGNG